MTETETLILIRPADGDVRYFLEDADGTRNLEEAAWCDWHSDGRLLLATRAGELALLEFAGKQRRVVWRKDLNDLAPERTHAPGWARR